MIAKIKDSHNQKRSVRSSLPLGLIALVAFLWVAILLNSIYTYRSPLHNHPPKAGERLDTALTKRLVFVLMDGLRLDTSLQSEIMPTLNDLRQKGAWATMHSQPPSYSQPAYTVLMTGASPELSDGPIFNLDYDAIRVWTQDNVFAAAHRAGVKTAVAGYYWFERLIPAETVDVHFYTAGEDRVADEQVVAAALPWLLSKDFQFILIHLDQVDYAGHHEGGPSDERWMAAAQRVDHLLNQIVATLNLSQDTLLVCSDHGHIDDGGHGGHETVVLREPFLLIGAGIKPGHYEDIQQVDVAPTIAALLGINLPASSQGRVLTEMLTLDDEALKIIGDAQTEQQRILVEAFRSAITSQPASLSVEAASGEGTPTMEDIRQSKFNAERPPRIVLSLLALAVGWVLILRRWKQELAYLLGGVVLYGAVFHIIYILIGKYAYSLSTIRSPGTFLSHLLVTVSIAYGLLCLLIYAVWSARKFALIEYREDIRGFTYILVYLLSLPVLWYFSLYGATLTWTLPDFHLFMVALLSLVQIGIVALLGVIFTALLTMICEINPQWRYNFMSKR